MRTIVSTSERDLFGAFFTIEQVKRANRESGGHYFDADTMRFFGSRVANVVIGGRFFITSERSGFDYNSPRMWSVREAMPDGSFETYGEFNEHPSSAAAKRTAREAAKTTHAYYFDGQHGKAGRRAVYVVTGAIDPWQAAERLHKNFRIHHMGRAQDYMLGSDGYVKLQAR